MHTWHGAPTEGASYFVHEGVNSTNAAQFEAVAARLAQLCSIRDGNEALICHLVFERTGPEEERQVVAYRFTSDWARSRYDHELVRLGGSLGRGGFDPFKDGYQMDTLVLGREPKRRAA